MIKQRQLLAGVNAVFAGTAVGMALPTLFVIAVFLTNTGGAPGEAILIMLMPFGIGLVASAIGILIIGGPVTVWLSRRGQESWRAYFASGVIGGTIPVFLIVWFLGEALLAAVFAGAFGAITGGAVGYFWWVFGRKKAAIEDTRTIAEMFE